LPIPPWPSAANDSWDESQSIGGPPHPSFSPNLASSDFYLFAKVETAVIWRKFNDEYGLFRCVIDLLHGISHRELELVCEEWLVWFDAWIQQGVGAGRMRRFWSTRFYSLIDFPCGSVTILWNALYSLPTFSTWRYRCNVLKCNRIRVKESTARISSLRFHSRERNHVRKDCLCA
jgi:hypothetical protein